jgi:hypothetical protein
MHHHKEVRMQLQIEGMRADATDEDMNGSSSTARGYY